MVDLNVEVDFGDHQGDIIFFFLHWITKIFQRSHDGVDDIAGAFVGMGADDRLKILFAEHLPAGIAGFPYTVSADDDNLAGFNFALTLLVDRGFRNPQRQSLTAKFIKGICRAVIKKSGVMSGANPAQYLLTDINFGVK